ncbi:MAG: hypothetical protein C0410_10530 [Anaerolinea sp.]|nr:hypothetical protein [Anaerolinea sp.]
MKRIAVILVILLFTLACAPLDLARSTLESVTVLMTTATPTAVSTSEPAATSIPTPTATLDPVNNATLYEDDFSDPNSGWEGEDDIQSRLYYSKGEYFVQASRNDYNFFMLSAEPLDDFVLNVDLRHVIGDDETTGGMVLWRYEDEENFYALTIMDDGTYTIHRFLQGVYGMLKLPTLSPWLNITGKTNLVTVTANGDTNQIFFNDHYEFSFQDSSLKQGYYGMGAQPSESSEVEVAFDNLKVYVYDPANPFTPASPDLTPTPEYQSITWKQLTQFLADDHTNWREYDLEDYNCMDYAIDLVANARYANISAKIITVQFVNQETGHAFVAFETSDRGTIFVEPQGDNTYSNVEIGNNLCDDWGEFECMGYIESVEYFGECDHAQNCTVLP